MKIKMTEHFQGTGQPSLQPGQEYDSTLISQALCDWLLEHRKAVDITPAPVIEEVIEVEPEEVQQEEKAAPRARKPRARAKK